AIIFPTFVEPVNETPFTASFETSSTPGSLSPCTRLTTPRGAPTSSSPRTNAVAVSGVNGDGFSTAVFPAIRAGASFHTGIATGKFQGLIKPTTPSGCELE